MPKFLNDLDLAGVSKIVNVVNGVNDQDVATVGQVKAAIEGVNWKVSARVATTANINLAATGTTVDGITMAVNDRVLVMAQTAATSNGIYIWNGAAVAMTRALDANAAIELEMATITVKEGTSAGVTFRQTLVNFVLDTGLVAFTTFGTTAPAASETVAGIAEIATQAETDTGTDDLRIVTPAKLKAWAGKPLKYSTTIGDGSATSYTVTHNLNTKNLQVTVSRVASPFDIVLADVQLTTANSLTVLFAAAPTAGQYNVAILG